MRGAWSWWRFCDQTVQHIGVWLFCLLWTAACRGITIAVLIRSSEVPAADVAAALIYGLRFDARAATIYLLPAALVSIACAALAWARVARATRLASAVVYCALQLAGTLALGPYYREFGTPFDARVLDLFHDDTAAIIQTALREYDAAWFAGVAMLGTILAWLMLLGWRDIRIPGPWHAWGPRLPRTLRAAYGLALVALLVVGARGSASAQPARREWSTVTTDPTLNDLVINALEHLRYAVVDYRVEHDFVARGARALGDGGVEAAVTRLFPDCPTPAEVTPCLHRIAPGGRDAEHVFVVLMESYDIWPLLEPYAALQVSTELRRIADDGLLVRRFLPASHKTIGSTLSLLTGLPDIGFRGETVIPRPDRLPPTMPELFAELGYRTRFFYGGLLSWRRIGPIARHLGFDEVYGSGHIEADGRLIWGVPDEALIDFVLATLGSAPDERSLNVILTVSNHPPYDIDLARAGWAPVRQAQNVRSDGRLSARILGHLWYSDKQIGRLYDATRAAFPESIWAFTGDHFGRRFPHDHPSIFELSAVPLVLVGAAAVPPRLEPYGSHIDLIPTLVDAVAPRGFEYVAVGDDVLARRRPTAVGHRGVITRDGVLRFDLAGGWQSPTGVPLTDGQRARLSADRRATEGLAWWLLAR